MKIKDLHYDLAKSMCEKRIKDKEHFENLCDDCPLNINNVYFCFKTILYYLKEYGDKEIKYEKED